MKISLALLLVLTSNSERLTAQNVECTWTPHFSDIPSWVLDPNQFDSAVSNWDCDLKAIGFPHNFSPIGPFFDAIIDDGSDVLVQPILPIAISNLELINNSSLTLVDGTDFLLQDTGDSGLVNATGDIFMTNSGSGLLTEMYLDGNIRFAGGGQILMDDSIGNAIRANTAVNVNGQMTLQNFTVEGAGNIGANSLLIHIDENSLIRANGSNMLVIDPEGGASSVFNNGKLQAGGGTLRLFDGGFDNSFGTIEALGGSVVEIANARVTGGIFESSGSGAIRALGGATFVGLITNNARFEIPGATVIYTGDLVNTNQVLIGTGMNASVFLYDVDTNLAGGGEVVLGDSISNVLSAVFDTSGRLTNVDNTISGSGLLGGRITNLGTIRANGTEPLIFQTQGVADGGINLGLMEAIDGSTLRLHISTLENAGGEVSAKNGGTVLLTGSATIQDGDVNIVGASSVELSASFIDATVNNNAQGTIATTFGFNNLLTGTINNPAGGTILLNDGSRLIFNDNGTYNNSGTIKLDGSGPIAGFGGTRLLIDNTVTLQGGGDVEMSNSVSNTIEARTGNPGTDILINQDHRIHGSGFIGRNTLAVTNRDTIEADQPIVDNEAWGTIAIDPGGAAGEFINEGTLRATNGGRILLINGAYNNRTGLIEVNSGSTIDMETAVMIDGGTIRSNGSGIVNLNGQVTFDGLFELNVDANITIHPALGRLILIGDITNGKTITNDRGGLRIDGLVNLEGGGSIVLVDNLNSDLRAFSNSNIDFLVNIDNTISGGGVIAVAITNQGTIRADGVTPLIYNIPGTGFDNQGLLQSTGSGGLQLIGGPFTNSGQVEISGGSTLFRVGDYVQTAGETIVNGTLEVSFLRTIDIQGGKLSGNGNLIGPVEFSGALAPGNSIGILNFTETAEFSGNSTFEFEFDAANGVAGVNSDLINCSGNLNLQQSGSSEFAVKLITLDGQGESGPLGDFDPAADYVFAIAVADSISNFNPNDFDLDLSGFGNTFTGEFSITQGPLGDDEALLIKYGQFKLGDVNHDGVVNLLDVAPFVAAISNGDSDSEADINCDGEVNLIDVAPFVALLIGG